MHMGVERQSQLLRRTERGHEMCTIRVGSEHYGSVKLSHLPVESALQVLIRHERQMAPEPVPQYGKATRKRQMGSRTWRGKRRVCSRIAIIAGNSMHLTGIMLQQIRQQNGTA